MALLVCYSSSPPEDHARKKALYLDQEFYELIFAHCRCDPGHYAVLREIASLRYKSPVMVVADSGSKRSAKSLRPLRLQGKSITRLESSGACVPKQGRTGVH